VNKKRFIKFIVVFLLVSFISFSSFQIKKTYTKAIAPAILLGYGVELLFSLAATAFVSNAVYNMGTEAKKIYYDWQNKKNDDEKKAQYGYWGEKLKSSMTSEEVENALNSAVNVIDGAVGLTLSSKSYQEFIDNVNKDRQKVLSVTFSTFSISQQRYNSFKNDTSSSYNQYFFKEFNSHRNSVVMYYNDVSDLLGEDYGFVLYYTDGVPILTNNSFSSSSSVSKGAVCGFYSNTDYKYQCAVYNTVVPSPVSGIVVDYNFSSDVDISGSEITEFETSQLDLEIQPNPDYDSTVSVSIPTTEISPEQLTESPYKENSEAFEYPDSFESTVNNTTINNELNKNPIKEGNEGLLDYGDTVNLDFSPLYLAVEDKFPFCIPFDLFHAIDTLTAEKEKPEFTITFPSIATSEPVSFTFNFDDYELVIEIFRYFVLLAFCIGLVINTKKILGGS